MIDIAAEVLEIKEQVHKIKASLTTEQINGAVRVTEYLTNAERYLDEAVMVMSANIGFVQVEAKKVDREQTRKDIAAEGAKNLEAEPRPA